MEIKVFVSQPMHGLTEKQIYNRRCTALGRLRKEINAQFPDKDIHIKVVNPIVHKDAPTTFPSETAKRLWNVGRSIQYMGDADAMLSIKGWVDARGCVVENQCWWLYKQGSCVEVFDLSLPQELFSATVANGIRYLLRAK